MIQDMYQLQINPEAILYCDQVSDSEKNEIYEAILAANQTCQSGLNDPSIDISPNIDKR
jgi:hypothetical protein